MTTTTSVSAPAGEWTPVSAGSASVTVQCNLPATNTPGAFLVAVGAAAPDVAGIGVIVTTANGAFAGKGLAETDNVYVYPINGSLTAQVIAS